MKNTPGNSKKTAWATICKVVLVGICSLSGSCKPAGESQEWTLKNDSLYLEEHYNIPLQYRLTDDPKPFTPRPVMMHMTDTHDHE